MSGIDRGVPERAVGERLFETAPGVFRIPLPTDFAVGDVNAYFVDGPDPVLIDTGVAGERNMACLAASLGLLGRGIRDIRHLLITHTHVDHSGSAADIRDASGCTVHAHPRGWHRLATADAVSRGSHPWFIDFMTRSGFSRGTIEKHGEITLMIRAFTKPCPDLSPLRQGDVLTLAGGRRFAVHESFGHSGDHVVFLLEGEGVLFSGDHVLPHITSNPTLEAPHDGEAEKARPLLLYRESLARVARLPVTVACPSHGLPFGDLAGRCREILDHHDRRCEEVLAILRDRGPMTRKDLGIALFGNVKLWEVYLTLSEVQAHVERLESEGRARVRVEGGLDLIEAEQAS